MFTTEFISLCQAYAEKQSQVLFQNIDDSKKCCKYSVEFYGYTVEFRYVKKNRFMLSQALFTV